MSKQPYAFVYKCKLKSITDGDTIRLETIDLGFSVQLHNKAVRINSIDTPESRINIKRYPERARKKNLVYWQNKNLQNDRDWETKVYSL